METPMIDRAKGLLRAADRWTMAHSLPRVLRRAVEGFLAHEGLQYAGTMAYFAVLSVFQLLVLAVVIGSFVLGEGAARDFVIEQVQAGTPLDAETIAAVIDGAIESRGSMTIVSFAFLAWAALGIFSALSSGISRVFEGSPPRSFLTDKLIGLVLMLLTGALAVASLVIGVVTGILQSAASDLVAGVPGGDTAVWLIGLLAPMILIFLAFWAIYRIVPNRPVGWMEVLPGTITGTLLWTGLRFGFTWYATSIARYDTAFGPLATGVTLLVFLYFASVIVLLGAEIARASALEDEVGALAEADPRFLPVPVDAPRPAPPLTRGGLPGIVKLGIAGLVGIAIGRLTKRDEY
jgi:membrane protein